ncbi:MAG TPA: glucosyl-3-phosphoglycerate synthase [Firmicutes bacterium]|nr:glucosyl-3-phosphoglycerate synthase [Bacillota bacterium]
MKDHILNNTFHHSDFQDIKKLVELKEAQGLKISLAFPTLNEERTIGKEILIIKNELINRHPLLDEIAVIDSDSTDRTREIAAEFGANVYIASQILPQYGRFRGKGENLWKSLYVLKGDIIVWIDADINNIHPKFVYGLLGALLNHHQLEYVKAFYERPISGEKELRRSGGGRVTEIFTRPVFSTFFPELASLIQPLSGEYAGRRELLEQLSFSVGYGVEIGHLLDIYKMRGTSVLGQVDLDMRIHRNQDLRALSRMSFALLNTVLTRLEQYQKLSLLEEANTEHIALNVENNRHVAEKTAMTPLERPPMITIKEYREQFKKDQ